MKKNNEERNTERIAAESVLEGEIKRGERAKIPLRLSGDASRNVLKKVPSEKIFRLRHFNNEMVDQK